MNATVFPTPLDLLEPSLDNCTLWPFVATLSYAMPCDPQSVAGEGITITRIVQATFNNPPVAEDMIPTGATLLRGDIFPATRFDDMQKALRQRYAPQYTAFLLWRKARSLDKTPGELKAWTDYDPIDLEDRVFRWANPDNNYYGD